LEVVEINHIYYVFVKSIERSEIFKNMDNQAIRIVSLLPSTTEIICALGMKENLVGRSHECDYPASVEKLPACTEPKFEPDGTSYQIDQRVKALLQDGLSVYRVDAEILSSLKPDVIITQDQCEVCAASLSEVRKAVENTLGKEVDVVSVSPADLSGVFDSIHKIAAAIGAVPQGQQLVQNMNDEFEYIQSKVQAANIRNICCLEWLEPLMAAGNWIPELVEIAGGRALGAVAGKHSPLFEWDNLLELDPEVISIMPCGYAIDKTLSEMDTLKSHKQWNKLKAVEGGQIYLLDGDQYFNRPGPRLTDSARIFAEILHPDVFKGKYRDTGWIKFNN
jgi:iron complex transport system substrate-binding protein